jgi:ankyrin repeat protein
MITDNQEELTNEFLTVFDDLIKEDTRSKPEELVPIFNQLDDNHKAYLHNHKDRLENTLLTDAANFSKEDLAITLIDLGFDINAYNCNGKSVLIFAVKNKLYSLVDKLLENNVDVNYARLAQKHSGNKVGSSALMFAAEDGEYDIVKKLVENGADINYVNDLGQFPLIYCVNKTTEHFKCYNYLIKQPNIIVNRVDRLGYGIFERIIKFGNTDFLIPALEKDVYSDKIAENIHKQINSYGLGYSGITPLNAPEYNTNEDALSLLDLSKKFSEAKELEKELSLNKNSSLSKKLKL